MSRVKLFCILLSLFICIPIIGNAWQTDYNALRLTPRLSVEDSPVVKIYGLDGSLIYTLDGDGNITTGKNILVCDMWLAPNTASTTGCTTASLFDTSVIYSNTVSITVLTQLVYPRNITWACTNPTLGAAGYNAGNTMYLVGYGIDAQGRYVTENIYSGTQPLSSAVNSGTGSVAFSRIDSVTFSTGFITHYGRIASSGPKFYIGTGSKLGYSREMYGDTPVKVIESGENVAKTSVTIDATNRTYTASSTLNGALNLVLWYYTRRLTVNP